MRAAVATALGRVLTNAEQALLDRLHGDTKQYSVADAVDILTRNAAPVAVAGPVTILNQDATNPAPAVKSTFNFTTSTGVNYRGQKAGMQFRALVELGAAPPNTQVGYLQTLRSSNRTIVVGGVAKPTFNLVNARDGQDSQAPWMVAPEDAVNRSVVITMNDEPGQWTRDTPTAPVITAQGTDVFTTWLVSTVNPNPAAANDVQFLYYWDWTIDWTNNSCTVTGSGPGQGGNTPVFAGGTGARSQYNTFLINNP
jgi:hypothetical protein